MFGIVLMLLAGFVLALQPGSPASRSWPRLFGIGAGLTLDEYALWLHLEDVYWEEQGRRSVDAVVISTLVGGLVLLGFLPVADRRQPAGIILSVLATLALAGLAIAKGKVVMGVVAMLFPLVGLIAAIRLAKPDSPWARRRYTPDGKKMAKAERRFAKHTRRYQRFQDAWRGRRGSRDT